MASRRKKVKRSVSRRSVTSRKLSPAQLKKLLLEREERKRLKRQEERAHAAVKKFRVRKADRGSMVFIGTGGQRNPSKKGRRGFLVYVTRTGKKRLLKQPGNEPYRARTITDIQAPFKGGKKFRLATEQFKKSRLIKTSEGGYVERGKGSLKTSNTQWDFTDKEVKKISNSLSKAFKSVRSHRTFLVQAKILAYDSDGEEHVFEINVPIDRADNIAIKLAGLQNFVRQKFYAELSAQLHYAGYVTSGSANHVRRLKQNTGKDRSEWKLDNGLKWRGNEDTVVKIRTISWRILQAK